MTTEQLKVLIDQARNVAKAAHKGQKRSDGQDYFETHVEPVAKMVEDRLKPIAYLHDVTEDTPVTLQDLIDAGFPKYVTDAVALLHHHKNEPRIQYMIRIAGNRDAAEVKIKDMKHNLSDAPTDRQKDKYTNKGLNILAKYGYNVS